MSNTHSTRKQISISTDHPSLAGHFPGNPVVPGVVILDHVRQCIEEWKHLAVENSNLKSVKFLSPVLMKDVTSQLLNVVLEERKAINGSSMARIEFRCLHEDELIVQGLWLFQADRAR